MNRKPTVDIGLTALVINAKPGQTLSNRDIAEVCECSPNIIFKLEKQAIEKLRLWLGVEEYIRLTELN